MTATSYPLPRRVSNKMLFPFLFDIVFSTLPSFPYFLLSIFFSSLSFLYFSYLIFFPLFFSSLVFCSVVDFVFSSILFYSILFYFILFYFILSSSSCALSIVTIISLLSKNLNLFSYNEYF